MWSMWNPHCKPRHFFRSAFCFHHGRASHHSTKNRIGSKLNYSGMSAWIKWINWDNGRRWAHQHSSFSYGLINVSGYVPYIKWFCALKCGTLITVSIDNDLPFWINFQFSSHNEECRREKKKHVFITLSSLYLTTICSSLLYIFAPVLFLLLHHHYSHYSTTTMATNKERRNVTTKKCL